MKILGKTTGGYIIDASEDEIAKLLGFWSFYALKDKSPCPAYNREYLNVGDDINVHSMYEGLTSIAKQEERMAEARAILSSAASALQLVDPVIREVAQAAGKKVTP